MLFACFSIESVVNAEPGHMPNDIKMLRKAFDILAHENVIKSGFVGGFEAVQPTEQGWAVSVILEKAKTPADTFASLADTGSYVGLLALYALDRARFDDALGRFRGTDKVIVVMGDSFEEMSSEEFIADFLPKNGRSSFERLKFKVLPEWFDTVKGFSEGPKSVEERRTKR
jgi:hypothetical protein